MRPVAFEEVPAPAWDEACDASSEAWLFHRAAWVSIEQRHFVRQNLSFALVGEDGPLCVQPLYLSDGQTGAPGELLLHSGIHRHTGLAVRDDVPAAALAELRGLVMSRVLSEARVHDVDRVQLNAHNLAPRNLTVSRCEIPFWVEQYGFHLGLHFGEGGMLPAPAMATCNADQIVDLAPSDEALFAALDAGCRQAIRKARRHGIAVQEADGTLDDYWALARRSAERTGEQLPPEAYYRELFTALMPSGRCAALFVHKEGLLVAALLLGIDKAAATFLAGVSDPEFLPFRVNEFLHWSAIAWAKRAGLRRYRLGPWFPEVPADWPIARVSRFKTKFGGRSWTTIQGSLFRKRRPYVEAARRLLDRLLDSEP